MKLILTLAFLLMSSPAWAGAEMAMAFFGKSVNYSTSSFEIGTDGWTFGSDVTRTSVTAGTAPGDGGSWVLSGGSSEANRYITKTLTTASGNVYFYYRSTADGTSAQIDGTTVGTYTSTGGVWTRVSAPIATAGSHTIKINPAYLGSIDYVQIPVP